MRTPKDPEPPIEYWDKMRQWQPGTWPVYHTWDTNPDGSFKWANYDQQIDDGTDDNEVLNVHLKEERTKY